MRFDTRYTANAIWGPRDQTALNLAERQIKFSEALKRLHPSLERWWFCEHDGVVKPVPSDPAALVDRMRPRPDADPSKGGTASYQCEFRNMPGEHTTWAATSVRARASRYSGDGVVLLVPDFLGEPDPALYDYDILRNILLAMNSTFDVGVAKAWPSPLSDIWTSEDGVSAFRLKPTWITYVGPRLAPLLTPVPDAIREDVPGGGVLLSATRERFDVKNPHHVAVARAIAASGDAFRFARDNPLGM